MGSDQPYTVRQGDVLLIRRHALPAGLTRVPEEAGQVVLARGERSGHRHTIAAREGVAYFRSEGIDPGVGGWLVVDGESVLLEHQEHRPVTLPPGIYQQAVQVEEVSARARAAADPSGDSVTNEWVRAGLATPPRLSRDQRPRRHRLLPHDQLVSDLRDDRDGR